MFKLPFDSSVAFVAFFGTLVSYNFIKYEFLFRLQKILSNEQIGIVVLSLLSVFGLGYGIFMLESSSIIVAAIFGLLTFLYAIPFLPEGKNMRNRSGIKIYIVAFCWAGVTLLLPLLNAGTEISTDVVLKFFQRFLLVIILILIFEIVDLEKDEEYLKTVPQKIGIANTKKLNLVLLLVFYCLELFKSSIDVRQLLINVPLIIAVALFTFYARPGRNKYYTLFWVESIPILWLGLVYLTKYL